MNRSEIPCVLVALLAFATSSCGEVTGGHPGDFVTFDASPGGRVFIDGREVAYEKDYQYAEGATVSFTYSVDLLDRYRFDEILIQPDYPSVVPQGNAAGFIKNRYDTRVYLLIREYSNRLLAPSPDGLKAAFVRDDTIDDRVYEVDFATGKETFLFDPDEQSVTELKWASDSRLIVGKGAYRNGSETVIWYAISTPQGTVAPLFPDSDAWMATSADGRYGAAAIVTVDGKNLDFYWRDGQAATEITVDGPEYRRPCLAAVEGEYAAFIIEKGYGGQRELVLWNSATGAIRKLKDALTGIADNPIWCGIDRDSASLVAVRNARNGSSITAYDLNDGSRRTATDIAGQTSFMRLSGGGFYYETTSGDAYTTLYRLDLAAPNAAPQAVFTRPYVENIRPLPSGGYAYLKNPYSDSRRAYRDAVVLASDGTTETILSPDDKELLGIQ